MSMNFTAHVVVSFPFCLFPLFWCIHIIVLFLFKRPVLMSVMLFWQLFKCYSITLQYCVITRKINFDWLMIDWHALTYLLSAGICLFLLVWKHSFIPKCISCWIVWLTRWQLCALAMYIQLSEAMYYALLEPDMDFIFKERGRFNVKASRPPFTAFVRQRKSLDDHARSFF